MFSSATEIIQETTVDEESFIPNPTKKDAKKEFAVRYACLQNWFLRCSSVHKLNFVQNLLKNVAVPSLALVINTIDTNSAKDGMYAECHTSTNFLSDKMLSDHDRALDKEALELTMQRDVEWFSNLPEFEQVIIIIGLIRMAGGAIIRKTQKYAVKLYQKLTENAEIGKTSRGSLFSLKSEAISRYSLALNAEIAERNISTESEDQNIVKRLRIIPKNVAELLEYDRKDPINKEVEDQRKKWNAIIGKYRIQVEGKPKKDSKKEADKKGKKEKLTSESKSKTNKSDKSGKKSMRKNEEEAIDQIQMLPVWGVKQIFSYLDIKTLQKLKHVNSYWNWVISDLQKDLDCRRYLDKSIAKMQAKVDVDKFELLMIEDIAVIGRPRKTQRKKRTNKLLCRGATHPALHRMFEEPSGDTSLLKTTIKEDSQEFILPVSNLQPFPRVTADSQPLHTQPSCVLTELGITVTENQRGVSIQGSVDVPLAKKDADNEAGSGIPTGSSGNRQCDGDEERTPYGQFGPADKSTSSSNNDNKEV